MISPELHESRCSHRRGMKIESRMPSARSRGNATSSMIPVDSRNSSSSRRSIAERCWTAPASSVTVQTSVGCLTCFSNRWTGCAFAARRLRRCRVGVLNYPNDRTSVRCHAARRRRVSGPVSPQTTTSCSVDWSFAARWSWGNEAGSRKRVGNEGAGAPRQQRHHTPRMMRLTNIDIAAAVERAVDKLATEKERGSAPQATLLLLGKALARAWPS